MKKREYALYKGDKYLFGGTKQELAEYLGVKLHTITFYNSKTWLNRIEKKQSKEPYIVIQVED